MKYTVTNIRVEAPMLRAIKQVALVRGVPASAIIREALQEYLVNKPLTKAAWDQSWKEFMSLAGTWRRKGKQTSTGSTDIDEVLYGLRRRRKKE